MLGHDVAGERRTFESVQAVFAHPLVRAPAFSSSTLILEAPLHVVRVVVLPAMALPAVEAVLPVGLIRLQETADASPLSVVVLVEVDAHEWRRPAFVVLVFWPVGPAFFAFCKLNGLDLVKEL